METISIGDMVLHVAPESDPVMVEDQPRQGNIPESHFLEVDNKPTIGEIARKNGWKVGEKEVRVIGHGGLPDHPVEENGWILMRAIDYEGIVPQEALDRVRILIKEGIEIKGLIIADDLRRYRPGKIHKLALDAVERVRAIDWQGKRIAVIQMSSTLAKAVKSAASNLAGGVKKKADEVPWDKVKQVSVVGLKAVAAVSAIAIVAVLALPILAVAAAPAAVMTLDPWLIVIDSENRRWLVAEWFD